MISAQNEFVMTVFSHDSYILSLPPRSYRAFYDSFTIYQSMRNYQNNLILQAPIIRLFGTTPSGQKACVHVHGYFPFLYIKVEHLKEGFKNPDYAKTFLSLVQNLFQEAYKYKHPVIYRGYLQQKYDFYGYHSAKQLFLKIYVYDQHQITKLRQLFASKVINGQMLQPFNAHISYIMHFFGELNIYGLHEILFTNFKFRKNIVGQEGFAKINTLNLQKLEESQGLNMNTLLATKPNVFSILQKTSSCYIELDVSYDNIVNYLQNMMNRCNEQEEPRTSIATVDMNQINSGQRKFKVQITKALNQFWFDQKQRRQKLGIKKEVSINIDYSKNLESNDQIVNGKLFNFDINFVTKKEIKQQLKKYVTSFCESKKKQPTFNLFVDKNVIQNYDNVLDQRMNEMITSVTNRWKFYSERNKQLIDKIIKGQSNQIPNWDELSQASEDQKQEDQQNKNQNQNQIQHQESLYDKLLNQSINTNNMAIFRNNYTTNKGIFSKDGYFNFCDFCKSIVSKCQCVQGNNEAQATQNTFKFINNNSNTLFLYKYLDIPPSTQKVIQQSVHQKQFPFFSCLEDLFEHYKIPKTFPRTKEVAQFLDFQMKPNKKFINIASIQNKQKLPTFWRLPIPFELQEQSNIDYQKFKYLEKPPSLMQVLQNHEKPKQERKIDTRRKQNVFLCNIVQINFQLICQCQNFYANPQTDRIIGVIFSITNQISANKRIYGVILISNASFNYQSLPSQINDIFVVNDQKSLLLLFALIVFKTDPDLLVSFDHEKKGIYYLVVRGFHHKFNYTNLLGRALLELDQMFDVVTFKQFKMIKSSYFTQKFLCGQQLSTQINSRKKIKKHQISLQNLQNRKKTAPVLRKKYNFNINVKGRVSINIFRILEHEKKLSCYTIEYMAKQLFGLQLPEFTDKYIFQEIVNNCGFVVDYYFKRVSLLTDILQKINVIGGLVEKSKLYGCNFISMLQRGSQFKIQAIMSRVCMHSGYLLLSATRNQVSQQKVLECRPLVLEPPKQLFVDPVLVFDFQSLYPSVMIAFNLCYSTCLGNIKQLFNRQTRLKRFGVSKCSDIDLSVLEQIFSNFNQQEVLTKLEKYIFVTPNKVAFLTKNIKQGILPRMLLQFLMTRILIKNSSSLYKSQSIQKLLQQRQIAIKLFMNVTYGYTGATFSGRMPCSQIADSIVQLAKFCLTSCMKQIHENPKYGNGTIIYGDTDSIFYHLKGKTMEDSFKIGKMIASDMTKKFPYPVQLKFEKVYQSLVLVSKKRYYGKKYQSYGGQPKYQGKGLECVRRDTVELVSNTMTNVLNKLFDTKDLSLVKQLFQKQVSRIKYGEAIPTELSFAKQVKLIKYGELPPAHGNAAKKLENIDPMLAPKYGQRMKYLVLRDGQNNIKDRSMPLFLYQNQQVDNQFYISKHLFPSLQRVFTSIVSIDQWVISAPRLYNPLARHAFSKKYCIICGCPNVTICSSCCNKVDQNIANIQKQLIKSIEECKLCIGYNNAKQSKCIQWNCSNLWKRRKAQKVNKIMTPTLKQISKAIQEFNK